MQDRQITGRTRLGGLIGSPVAHSISPMMQGDSFAACGIDAVYLCFDVTEKTLSAVVSGLREMNAYGFNVTMPLKTAIVPLLDELSEEARLIGAVNTVKIENRKLTGYNTDGVGYMESVRRSGLEMAGKEMILLGAGGAASAIAVQAALDGVSKLHIVSRRGKSWAHAGELAEKISLNTACEADRLDLSDTETLRKLIQTASLLTNATSVGMGSMEGISPWPEELRGELPASLMVSDVIYQPRMTKFLEDAAACGCRIGNGMYMLLYQGAEAFKIWTGKEMPVEQIRSRYFL